MSDKKVRFSGEGAVVTEMGDGTVPDVDKPPPKYDDSRSRFKGKHSLDSDEEDAPDDAGELEEDDIEGMLIIEYLKVFVLKTV